MPFADLKARAAEAVEGARAEILDLSHRIHANPEPAFEERQAATWVAEAIRAHGFAVEHPAGSLETAVRGRLTGGLGRRRPADRHPRRVRRAARPRPRLRPQHDGGVGGRARRSRWPRSRDAWAGEVVFLGTPAEERGSGKAIMIREGLFEGLDAALLYHPCDRSHVEIAPLASEDVHVTFTGLAVPRRVRALERRATRSTR